MANILCHCHAWLTTCCHCHLNHCYLWLCNLCLYHRNSCHLLLYLSLYLCYFY